MNGVPYQGGQRLTTGEQASKLGHIDVVNNPFVRELIQQFEPPDDNYQRSDPTHWVPFDGVGAEPLETVLAVDGSMQVVSSDSYPQRSVAFIKTALFRLDRRRIDMIDKEMPHPVQMKALMSDSALQLSTVLPLRNIPPKDLSNYHRVRHIIRESLMEKNRLVYDTLKWLAYRKWDPERGSSSPNFQCPHCSFDIWGLPYDADSGACEECAGQVFLTDMLGFHLEMGEDQAPDQVASDYMLVHETLLLFSVVQHLWEKGNYQAVNNVLLLKDGPLALRGQYSKLVPNIRTFLEHARGKGFPVHLAGQEKSGRFVDHLACIHRFSPPTTEGQLPHFAILSHRFIREHVDHAPGRLNPYGLKTNYGEKVYAKLDPYTSMVLSVPTGEYNPDPNFPDAIDDFIGLNRILATLPSLVRSSK